MLLPSYPHQTKWDRTNQIMIFHFQGVDLHKTTCIERLEVTSVVQWTKTKHEQHGTIHLLSNQQPTKMMVVDHLKLYLEIKLNYNYVGVKVHSWSGLKSLASSQLTHVIHSLHFSSIFIFSFIFVSKITKLVLLSVSWLGTAIITLDE
jgi:hypothetical protein